MCGIVGIIGRYGLSTTDADIFEHLLLINSLRGKDSTGLFAVNKQNPEIDFIKHVDGPSYLFDTEAYRQLRDNFYKYDFIIGHGRLATVGEVSVKNAHPFTVNQITLVHNGKLNNFAELKKKHRYKTDVDSELAAYLFSKYTIEEVLDMIDAAYSFVFYNQETNKLYISRNTERPLNVLVSPHGKWVISSETPIFELLRKKFPGLEKAESRYFAAEGYYWFDFNAKSDLDLNQTKEERVSQKKYGHPGLVTTYKQSYHPQTESFYENSDFLFSKGEQIKSFYFSDIRKLAVKAKKGDTDVNVFVAGGYLTEDPYCQIFLRLYTLLDVENIPLLFLNKAVETIIVDVVRNKISFSHGIRDVEPIISANYAGIITKKDIEPYIESEDLVKFGLSGDSLPRKEAEKLLKEGCSVCPSKLGMHNVDYVGLVYSNGHPNPFCLHCYQDWANEVNIDNVNVH